MVVSLGEGKIVYLGPLGLVYDQSLFHGKTGENMTHGTVPITSV